MASRLISNTIANYIGLAFSTLATLAVVPFYIDILGAEVYGLIGFFIVVQVWLSLLDMGLSPTLARQAARVRAGREKDVFPDILRSFEWIFLLISLGIAVAAWLFSDWVASHWLQVETLLPNEVAYCVVLMGLVIAIRFFSSLYRSGINGLEDQVWLSGATVVFVALRTFFSVLFLLVVSDTPSHFFEYQAFIALLELFVLRFRFYGSLSSWVNLTGARFSYYAIKELLPFSLSVAYASTVWIAVMQVDKLILSKYLLLSEYGYFTVVVVLSNGILQIFTPAMQAFLPRITALVSQGKEQEMIHLYRNMSQLVTLVVMSSAFIMAIYSEPLIYAWTGDEQAAKWGGDIMFWYVLGNAIVALSSFQYNIQNAYGDLRLHVKGVTLSAIIQIPVMIYAAIYYGAMGAAFAWFSLRLIWFFLWVPLVHGKFIPGVHMKWVLIDILPIVIVSFVATLFLHVDLYSEGYSRIGIAVYVLFSFLFVMLVSSIASRLIAGRITRLVVSYRWKFFK